MIFNDTFIAMLNEAQFTGEMLGAGATQIRNASYFRKGAYFQAFTSLSTGLERIGKLCLLLDYYADNNGSFPNQKYLKHEIGHDILLLYANALSVIKKRSLSFEFRQDLEGKIHQSILAILSAFAKGDRYSNLNLLVKEERGEDPIDSWYRLVDQALFETRVSAKKKEKIAYNSLSNKYLLGQSFTVLAFSESRTEISDVQEASYRIGMQEAVAPYRQLYVLQIIRFWVELLFELHYVARDIGEQEIPHLSEVFAPFFNSDKYLRSRKTWDKF